MDPFSQNVDEKSQLQYFTQQHAADTFAQDFDSFGNMSLAPYSIDPMDDNQFLDWNYLEKILHDDMTIKDMTVEEADYVVGDEGGVIQTETVTKYGGGSGNGWVVASQMNNGSNVGCNSMMNARPRVGENVKNRVPRKRYKKGPEEAARKREEHLIRNRVSAVKAFERKKAHIHDLQLLIQKLRKENAYLRKLIRNVQGANFSSYLHYNAEYTVTGS